MKKVSFFTLLLMMSSFVFSQNKFIATPSGLITENNILVFPGKSATEIYNAVKLWSAKNFENPAIAIKSDVAPEYFRVKGYWHIDSKGIVGSSKIGLFYTLTLDIKDGKMRYTIDQLSGGNNFDYQKCFKANGERRNLKEVNNYLHDIEIKAESFIKNLSSSVQGTDNW